ncbi:sensor histidine kinase [Streptomyces chartreusis]
MARDKTEGNPESMRWATAIFRPALRDLFVHPFACQPFPVLPQSPALARIRQRLPRGLRPVVDRLPYAAVALLAAGSVVTQIRFDPIGGPESLMAGAPIVLTLLMPAAAWWLTIVMTLTASVDLFGLGSFSFAAMLTTGPIVLALCTLRLRLATAAWMYLVSTAIAIPSSAFQGLNPLSWCLVNGVTLTVALLVRGWMQAGERAMRQASAAEDERGQRTRLEERTAIARELHDVVAHHMSVVAIQAEAARYRAQDAPPELGQSLAAVRENAVLALAEMRRILGVIRADPLKTERAGHKLAPQPTLAQLDSLINSVRTSGTCVYKEITGKVRELTPGVELSAYRIVQEALSNAMRHAPGSTVRVELSYVATGVGLRVVNGAATRTADVSPGAGHGLLGMRERITMLEGQLTAQPTDDGGFEVSAFLPASTKNGTGDA